MKKLILFLITLCLCTSMQAQQKKGKCTEGEFRNKREAYLKEKAQLTDEEAALVLPLYFEMLEKKELNNKEPWKKIKATNISNATGVPALDRVITGVCSVFAQPAEQAALVDRKHRRAAFFHHQILR